MKLPNGDRAVVDDAKLRDYCLSTTHPRGRHKARLFASTLGIRAEHIGLLKSALLDAVANNDATATRRNAFGQIYEIRFQLRGPTRQAEILSVWIIRDNDPAPNLVTCYPI
jgi:hypothetical protein